MNTIEIATIATYIIVVLLSAWGINALGAYNPLNKETEKRTYSTQGSQEYYERHEARHKMQDEWGMLTWFTALSQAAFLMTWFYACLCIFFKQQANPYVLLILAVPAVIALMAMEADATFYAMKLYG